MANELLAKSYGRDGTPVIWISLHTAEGAFDDNPANPTIDPGSARNILNFFLKDGVRASSHAICDDDVTLEVVPYDRAAWTLRDGNQRSDNLEMAGRAGWSRAEWLKHRPMIRRAAKWTAGRCHARDVAPRYAGITAVRNRSKGVIDHNDYTVGTGDGEHWDVGPNFPWDVFNTDLLAYYAGTTPIEGDFDMATSEEVLTELRTLTRTVRSVYDAGFAARAADGSLDPTHEEVSIRGVNVQLNRVSDSLGTMVTLLDRIAQRLDEAAELSGPTVPDVS